VGLGFGASVHVPALRSLEGVEVVAVMGRQAAAAEDAARRVGVARGVASVEELLELRPDAVSLAVPPDQNATLARQLLERGVAVLSEKPLALSFAEAAELVPLTTGLTTAVDFELGETRTFGSLRDLVRSRRLGKLRRVEVCWRMEASAYRQRRWSWKLDAQRGGGVLSLLGSHVFHLLEDLAGPIRRLLCVLNTRGAQALAPPGASAADDDTRLVLLQDDGILSTVALCNSSAGGLTHRWELGFDLGTASAENPTPDPVNGFRLTLRERDGEDRTVVAEPDWGEDGRLGTFRALAGRFVTALRLGRPCAPDFAAGARVQALMEASRRSSEEHRLIEVPPPPEPLES